LQATNTRAYFIGLIKLGPGKPFQPRLMFVGRAKKPKASFRYSTWAGSSLFFRMERLASDKHSSLLRTLANFSRKKFYTIGPRFGIHKASYKHSTVILIARVPFHDSGLCILQLAFFCQGTLVIIVNLIFP
jgi:hypothetical protein